MLIKDLVSSFLLWFGSLAVVGGTLVVESDKDGFSVSIDSTLLIKHHNDNPAFSLSSTKVTFEERQGNFIIEEETLINADSLPLDLFQLDYYDVNGLERVRVIFNSSLSQRQLLKVEFWEGEVLEGLPLDCSFSAETLAQSPDLNRISMNLVSSSDENLYGLGEQFTHFDLKGYNFTVWTREQGVGRNLSDPLTQIVESQERGAGGDYDYTYFPQSSFISAQSRYLFGLHSNTYTIFDFRGDNHTQISFQSKTIQGYFLQDPSSLLGLVQKVSQVYGRQPELPEWVYNGAILGVQGGTQKMLDYLEQAEEAGVGVAAMWIQDWSGKINTGFGTRVFWNWKWNSTWYPRLDDVIRDLRDSKGIRVLAYINPSLNSEGDIFKEGDDLGVFLREEGNLSQTYLQDFGGFNCGTVDLWDTGAAQWYKQLIRENMIRFGLAGWMADFGEYTPLTSTSVTGTIGLSAQERHNQFPTLWAKLNREAVEEEGTLGDTLFWSRAGSAQLGRYSTLLWAGDQNVDWSYSDGLPSTITAGLSSGMMGVGLFHFDIGGYTTLEPLGLVRSKELLLRSAEHAVFSTPVMRTHEGNQPLANHQVYSDPDTWAKFGRLTQIFRTLSNYTSAIVREYAREGTPLMRPLFLHYESDPESFNYNYQFLYGRDLLVAPILDLGQDLRETYLPADSWVHLWDPSVVVMTGPTNVTVSSPLGYPPVFYRNGTQYQTLFQQIRVEYGQGFQ